VNPTIPFAVRRPWLLTRELFRTRSQPDVARLRAIDDPETFVWKCLPHAARTFAACITLLPKESARTAAVAYLYCRILDTYEDLIPDGQEREAALAEFGARFTSAVAPPGPAPRIARRRARDRRDQAHVVLVNRCQLVDQVYSALTPHARRNIAQLVESMSGGMIWSSRTFADQGGVLTDERQLSRYCRNVIGLPFLFGVRLLHQQRTGSSAISDDLREDCLVAGEMVQLANITRDIEADLRRGIAYHPALAQDLVRPGQEAGLQERIRRVREELLVRALAMAPAYQRMMEALPFRRVSLSRASGVLMLQFTDRYYRSCARNVGRRPWPGPRSRLALIASTGYHVFARQGSARTVRRIAERFVRFALETKPRGSRLAE